METLNKYINHGIRGTYYILRHIFGFIFLLSVGFVLGFLFFMNYKIDLSRDENIQFVLLFGINFPVSLFLWFIFRRLYKKSVTKHITEIKKEILEDLKN